MNRGFKNIPIGSDTSLIKVEREMADIKVMSHNINQQYFKIYDRVVPACLKFNEFLIEKGEINPLRLIEHIINRFGIKSIDVIKIISKGENLDIFVKE